MSEEHGNLIKNTKQLSVAVIASFFVPLIIIFLLIVYVSSGKNKQNVASEKSTETLIKPVGKLNFKDASAPREVQTGEGFIKRCALLAITPALLALQSMGIRLPGAVDLPRDTMLFMHRL